MMAAADETVVLADGQQIRATESELLCGLSESARSLSITRLAECVADQD